MAKADFSSFLSVPVDDIERPRALPLGHFHAVVKGWKTDERNYARAGDPPKITPIVSVSFTITGADDDVDETDMPDDLSKVAASKDYDLTDERGMFALRQLTQTTCGIDTKGLNLQDALDAIKGSDVKLYNEPRAGKNEGEFYTNISRVLSAS